MFPISAKENRRQDVTRSGYMGAIYYQSYYLPHLGKNGLHETSLTLYPGILGDQEIPKTGSVLQSLPDRDSEV
jgi:hypothetical protein